MGHVGRVFISAERLRDRVREIGHSIGQRLPPDVLLVTVVNSGGIFLADLVRTLTPEVNVDFLALSRYESTERPPGAARVIKDLDTSITGRHVLIVEDVVDTGLSLSFLLRTLQQREPAALEVCTLLDREDKRLIDVPIAYRGFRLGDEYLVGYGLDFLGLYRNLPCLVAVDDLEALEADPLALVPELWAWSMWTEAGYAEQ